MKVQEGILLATTSALFMWLVPKYLDSNTSYFMFLHVKFRAHPSLSVSELMHFLGFPDLQLTDTGKLWIPLYAPPVA